MIRSILASAALLLVTGPALAWGSLGHRLVADLAWTDMTPKAKAEAAKLLKGEADPTLSGIASWADELRRSDPSLGRRSASWHYVNIAEEGCQYEANRDCRDGNCVVEAIRRQSAILADRKRSKAERLQALKFVVHFVGDVHQPLHAGYGHDKGGGDRQINFEGRGTNLHAVWDSGLLRTAKLDEPAYLARLRAMPAPSDTTVAAPSRPQPVAWAEASCATATSPGFYPPRASIGQDYVQKWRPIAEAQLRLGGVHLATVLNDALGR
ncbi:MAG: S1/P1 nuclease [Pseudoxanthomonas sp.]